MAWIDRHNDESIKTAEPGLVREWEARLRAAGFDESNLHGFTLRDLAEDLPKHRLLLAYNMGLGKTRAAIAAAAARGTKHTLFVVPNKLIGEWEREFEALGLTDQMQVITQASQISGYECPKGCGEISDFQPYTDANGQILRVDRVCGVCGAPARHLDRGGLCRLRRRIWPALFRTRLRQRHRADGGACHRTGQGR